MPEPRVTRTTADSIEIAVSGYEPSEHAKLYAFRENTDGWTIRHSCEHVSSTEVRRLAEAMEAVERGDA